MGFFLLGLKGHASSHQTTDYSAEHSMNSAAQTSQMLTATYSVSVHNTGNCDNKTAMRKEKNISKIGNATAVVQSARFGKVVFTQTAIHVITMIQVLNFSLSQCYSQARIGSMPFHAEFNRNTNGIDHI